MDEKNEGLKENENDTQENQPASENEPAEEGIKTQEELDAEADKLLADGTPKDKNIVIKKDKFDDKNEKAKLYEATAPLLEKIIQNPDLVEKLMGKDSTEERLRQLEEDKKAEKRAELKNAVSEALSRWPQLDKDWKEIEEFVQAKIKRGIPPFEAIRREFIALHPELAQEESERIAREGLNREGTFSQGGNAPRVKQAPKTNLSEDEKKVAKALGHSEEDYAKLLSKHKDWIETNARRFN